MISKKIVLHFPRNLIDQPITYHLTKEYDLAFNILHAKITADEEGLMILELSGEDKNYEDGIKYLKKQGVVVQPLSKDIRRNDERCTQCGVCVTVCPTEALFIPDREKMIVEFDVNKCTGCELCVPACPVRAMEVHLV